MEIFPRSLQLPQFPAALLSTISDLNNNKSFICETCQEHFMTSRGLEIHSNKIHMICPKTSVCSVCSKSFKNKYLLTAHHKQVHEARQRVSCSKCDKDFCNKSTLQKHMKKKHLPVVNIN
jgi:hypothetical protein